MRSKRLPGLPVLCIADGSQLGRVRRPLVDPKAKSVIALLVATGAVGGRKVLPMDAVHALGTHAVTVHRPESLVDPKGDEPLAAFLREERTKVVGAPVVTRGGLLVGTVQDYEIGQAGAIEALYVTQSVWRALAGGELSLPGAMLVALGPDAAIVADEALSLVTARQEAKRERPGGLFRRAAPAPGDAGSRERPPPSTGE